MASNTAETDGRRLAASAALGVAAVVVIVSAGAGVARPAGVDCTSRGGQEPPRAAAPARVRGVDRYGDPLPEGAIARLGSLRFRHVGADPGDFLNRVAFTPDGAALWTLGADGEARVWDVASGRLARSIDAGQAALSPDGKTVFGARPGLFRAIDRATGRERRRRPTAPRGPRYLAVSPDGKSLALIVHPEIAGDRDLILYDAATLDEWRRIDGDHQQIRGLAFSPDGRTLAFAGPDPREPVAIAGQLAASVRLYDVESGAEVRRISFEGFGVASVAFSPDGRTLAAGVGDRTIRRYNPATGRERLPRLGRVGAGKDADRPPVAASLAFSPDGRLLAAGPESTGRPEATAAAPPIVIWDVAAAREAGRVQGHPLGISSLAFSPDGKTLASSGGDEVARLWDVATGREVDPRAGHPRQLIALVVSPVDGTVYTAGCNDDQVLRWDPSDGRSLGALPVRPRRVDGLAISADGRTLFVGDPGAPTLLDLTGREPPRRLADVVGSNRFFAPLLSPNGRRVVSGMCVWDAATGKDIAAFHGGDPWDEAAFTADGRGLITVEAVGVRIRDIPTGAERARPVRADLPGWNLAAISPDGRLAATRNVARSSSKPTDGNSPDPAIGVWELASGRRVARLFGHTGESCGLAFSPDGRLLASISGAVQNPSETEDPSLRVWDVATGRQERRFAHPTEGIPRIAFLPDGRSIVTAGNGTTLVWDVADLADRRVPEVAGAEALESLWSDLASADAPRGFRASWKLAFAGAVPFLRDRLRPAAAGEPAGGTAALRARRAIAALERIGDPTARAVLETLARGEPGAPVTSDAAAALARLSRVRGRASVGVAPR